MLVICNIMMSFVLHQLICHHKAPTDRLDRTDTHKAIQLGLTANATACHPYWTFEGSQLNIKPVCEITIPWPFLEFLGQCKRLWTYLRR